MPEFELAVPPSRLGLDAVVTKDGPHPTVRLGANGTTRAKSTHWPCHLCATSDGQSRSRADNHGHCRPTDELAVSRSSCLNASPRMCLISGGAALREAPVPG
jgi:hypothetical protein